MNKNFVVILLFASIFAVGNGDADPQLSNYDLSRRDSSSLFSGGYGHYPSGPNGPRPPYPSGPGYPSAPAFPGQGYPHPAPGGPPGAHHGCPLCDSSVYTYCSYKQEHDACCCENPAFLPYSCRKSSCRSLYANSCQEYHLISSCCCVDVQKNANTINSVETFPVAPVL